MKPSHPNPLLAFVGGGNMAGSIIGGLTASGWPANRIRVGEPVPDRRDALTRSHGIECMDDNVRCVRDADIVILCVKPQVLHEVLVPLKTALQEASPLLVSVVAGIRSTDILGWIDTKLPFVRVMPNTPALINQGISGLWANELANPAHRRVVENTMGAVGQVVWLARESLMDTVTGVSGSGPAYFFKLMELMIQAAENHGLDKETAKILVLETALGAATLIHQSHLGPEELRQNVTSSGGTTEAGLRCMEWYGFDNAVLAGVGAAVTRSIKLSEQFGGNH